MRRFHLSSITGNSVFAIRFSVYTVDMKSVSSAYMQYKKSAQSGFPHSCQYSFSAASRYMMNSIGDNASPCGVPMVLLVYFPLMPATLIAKFVSERSYVMSL